MDGEGSFQVQPDPAVAAEEHRGGDHELEWAEREVSSLRELFRERRLSIKTMERPLRIATGGAVASFIGVVLLTALRDINVPSVILGADKSGVREIPTPLFVATLVLLSVGFGYVLSGAVLASRTIAALSLVVITAVIGVEAGAFGHLLGFKGFIDLLPNWARWATRGLVVAIWGVAAVVAVLDMGERQSGSGRRMRLLVLIAYTAIFGGYFAVLKFASPQIGGLNLFPEMVGLIMGDIALLVTPILLVAAVDFGEWGGLLGERVAASKLLARRWRLSLIAALLSITLAGYGYMQLGPVGGRLSLHRFEVAGRTVGLLGIALALIIFAGRALGLHRRRWPPTLNFAAIFVVCALGTYLIAPVSGLIAGQFGDISQTVPQVTASGEYTAAADVLPARGGSGSTAFTLLIPRGWLPNQVNGVYLWTNYAIPGDKGGQLVAGIERVGIFTVPGSFNAAAFAAGSKLPTTGPQTKIGPWTRLQIDIVGTGPGLLWARPTGSATLVLEELVKGAPLGRVRPQFEAIANSVRTADEPAAVLPQSTEAPSESASQSKTDLLQTIALAISAAIILALITMLATIGRRWPARLVGAMVLFSMTSLAALLFFADSIGRVVVGPGTGWPYVSEKGLLMGVGVLGLVSLVATVRQRATHRRVIVGLITLDATVWALEGMRALYDHALAAGRVSAWAAIILLVAIAWDVTMSGDSMTNHGSRKVPRASRVLAFFGYVILLSATVLYYSAQRFVGTGKAAEVFYEPEAVTQEGLFRIAFPLAVMIFLLRFGREPKTTGVACDAPITNGNPVAQNAYPVKLSSSAF